MSYRGKEKHNELPLFNEVPLRPRDNKKGLYPTISYELQLFASILVGWVMIVHFGERVHVKYVIRKCSWKKWEKWAKTSDPHRIAIIADPQLVDDNSYPDRPQIINYFITKISDNYLHRNYRMLQYYLDPDTILFLGDLFDGGRDWENNAWLDEFIRFNKVFPKQPNRRTIESLPGNHDIGFESIDPKHLDRFAAFFGSPNDYIELGNHTIILLDTISLSSDNEALSSVAKDFLELINDRINPKFPKILLTHVPLFRNNKVQVCGPLRESSKPFPVQKGKQYQTVISETLTKEILDIIKPSLIFSGDDHDYCQIQHAADVTEITVKSAAMTAGIKYPAIQLLSLYNPTMSSAPDGYLTGICPLPSPFFGITLYTLWFIVTVAALGIYYLKFFQTSPIGKYLPRMPNYKRFAATASSSALFGLALISLYYSRV